MQIAPDSMGAIITDRRGERLRRRDDSQTEQLLCVQASRCERSYNLLYEYYAPRICAYLRQKGAPHRISQEIMQDVMARVWEKANQFDPQNANASTWIFTIARNRYIDIVRKERRSVVDMNDPLLVEHEPAGADEGVARQDEQRVLVKAIGELPAAQSEILTLVYLKGMKQLDAAQQLGVPLNTVKSRLRLALQKLRSVMEAD